MTNERAIQILEILISIDGDVIIEGVYKEALEMAIRSLQQEQPCEDLTEAAETSYDTQQYTPRPSVDIGDVARVQFAAHAKVFDKKRKAVFDWEQFKEVVGIFYGFGMKDSLKTEEKEQPSEDLEAEMGKYFDGWQDDPEYGQAVLPHTYQCVGVSDCKDIARHFYELGKQSKEPVTEDLEEAAENYAEKHGFRVPYDGSEKFYDETDVKASKDGFIAGAVWQKSKDESRRMANIKLANTDVPVDTDMEIAFNDIWQDCEVRVERDGNLDEETTEAMKALCHDFFESGKEWQKSQMPMPEDTVLFNKGVAEGRRLERQDMLKDAVVGYVNYYEDGGGKLMAEAQVGCPYHIGDKVKIVIVPIKEDKE